MQKIYTAKEIKERLLPIFNRLPIKKAVLFGSYAKGNATESSDVDILIDSGGHICGIDFFGLIEEMTEVLNLQIDLIEASQIVRGGRVESEIAETGVIIYERA